MNTYENYEAFKTADRELRGKGKELSDTYLSHVKSALNFFHTAGAHNVQILNDVLDTASAMRLQRNRIVDWIEQLTGHVIVKLDGGKFGFGKKAEGVEYETILDGVVEFFEQYPDWYAFKKESEPDAFEIEKNVLKFKKYVDAMAKKAEEAHYSIMAATLNEVKALFESRPVMTLDTPEGEGEEGEEGEEVPANPVTPPAVANAA